MHHTHFQVVILLIFPATTLKATRAFQMNIRNVIIQNESLLSLIIIPVRYVCKRSWRTLFTLKFKLFYLLLTSTEYILLFITVCLLIISARTKLTPFPLNIILSCKVVLLVKLSGLQLYWGNETLLDFSAVFKQRFPSLKNILLNMISLLIQMTRHFAIHVQGNLKH